MLCSVMYKKGIFQKTMTSAPISACAFTEPAKQIKQSFPQCTLSVYELTNLLDSINNLCREYNINISIPLSIAAHESKFNHLAVGATGDYGLFQITEIAVQEVNQVYGVKYNFEGVKFDQSLNARVAIMFLAANRTRTGNDVARLILSFNRPTVAYNCESPQMYSYTQAVLNQYPEMAEIIGTINTQYTQIYNIQTLIEKWKILLTENNLI